TAGALELLCWCREASADHEERGQPAAGDHCGPRMRRPRSGGCQHPDMLELKVMPGRLFVFEGPDGVGKSTVSAMVAARLRADGLRCELMAFPGNEPGTLGTLIRHVHHQPELFGIAGM